MQSIDKLKPPLTTSSANNKAIQTVINIEKKDNDEQTKLSTLSKTANKVIYAASTSLNRRKETALISIVLLPLTRAFFGNNPQDALEYAVIQRALKRIPAYKQLIADHISRLPQEDQERIKKSGLSLDDIPIMTKDNYIRKYNKKDGIGAVYVDGIIPNGQKDSSSGTTGEPVQWYRDQKEMDYTDANLLQSLECNLSGKISFLNTFSTDYATGKTIARALDKNEETRKKYDNINTNGDFNVSKKAFLYKLSDEYIQKLILSSEYRPHKKIQIPIAGYPPFIHKLLSDKDVQIAIKNAKSKYKTKGLKLWVLSGGERMTPIRRKELKRLGIDDVRSSYGASDLTVGVGVQDEWCVKLEDACEKNTKLCQEIFKCDTPPSIFFYNPSHFVIRADKENRLLFTKLIPTRSDKLKYYLGDLGGVCKREDIYPKLKAFGIDIPKDITTTPIVYLTGREGDFVVYGVARFLPNHLEQALDKININGKKAISFVEDHGLHFSHDNQGHENLSFLMELKEGYSSSGFDNNQILKEIIKYLSDLNIDFKNSFEKFDINNVYLKIFNKNEGPVFQKHKDLKKIRVFTNNKLLNSNGDEI